MWTRILLLILILFGSSMAKWERDLIVDFCTDHVNVKHAVVFRCSFVDNNDAKQDYFELMKEFIDRMIFVRFIELNDSGIVDLKDILRRFINAKTCVVLNLNCDGASFVLHEASMDSFFNKTYQWLLLDFEGVGLNVFSKSTKKIGINSQVSYVNTSKVQGEYILYDLHSKGQHLKSPLLALAYGTWSAHEGLLLSSSMEYMQGISNRQQFAGTTLRGVVVVDRDDIHPSDLDFIMSNPVKTIGVNAFTKFHFALVRILQQYFNFTVNYRITHGWAGRLPNSSFRLGLLGVVQRNEADIAASGAFDRINRFAEMDTIHQSWKFEAAFLYRITADVKNDRSGGKSGFLAPFKDSVWVVGLVTVLVMIAVWEISINLGKRKYGTYDGIGSVGVNVFGAVCQQGLVKPPKRMSTRIIALALLILSLLMYNFYTSSVVGGLLSIRAQGPQNLTELMDSPLILSFEDIGYHKVIFRESNSSLVKTMFHTKIQPYRNPNLLPAYTTIKDAVPYLKTGRYAFHCEMIDAYPEIARLFDPNEICDLRSISGLFDIQIMNMIVTKRSPYTEIFRIALHRAREIGLINRELRAHRPRKPRCQSGSTVHPVTLNGVKNAFVILGGGIVMSLILLLMEIFMKRMHFCESH